MVQKSFFQAIQWHVRLFKPSGDIHQWYIPWPLDYVSAPKKFVLFKTELPMISFFQVCLFDFFFEDYILRSNRMVLNMILIKTHDSKPLQLMIITTCFCQHNLWKQLKLLPSLGKFRDPKRRASEDCHGDSFGLEIIAGKERCFELNSDNILEIYV